MSVCPWTQVTLLIIEMLHCTALCCTVLYYTACSILCLPIFDMTVTPLCFCTQTCWYHYNSHLTCLPADVNAVILILLFLPYTLHPLLNSLPPVLFSSFLIFAHSTLLLSCHSHRYSSGLHSYSIIFGLSWNIRFTKVQYKYSQSKHYTFKPCHVTSSHLMSDRFCLSPSTITLSLFHIHSSILTNHFLKIVCSVLIPYLLLLHLTPFICILFTSYFIQCSHLFLNYIIFLFY